MSLIAQGTQTVRFVPDGNGLKVRFENPYDQPGSPDENHIGTLALDAETSRDHGVLIIPVRLPRYLMPQWLQQQWAELIDGEIGFFHNFVDEAVVQCLSLAIMADKDRRAEVLRTANEVVIDFRGDLPNKYLPMMLGGYKVGVYRSGNTWPIWMSIQPTYDLAVKEAEQIRDEAGLPKKAIVSAGALSNFLNTKLALQPILSDQAGRGRWSGWVVAIAAISFAAATWLTK